MLSSDDVLRRFKELPARSGSIRLLNAYRGVPVSHPAWVLSVQPADVVLEVHPHQAACMALEGKTHLLGEVFVHTLQARVVAVDILRSQTRLAEFCQARASLGKRLAVRVQPAQPLEAQIDNGVQHIACELVDLSNSGVGLSLLNTHKETAFQLNKGQQVFLDVKLPCSPNPIRLRAKITSLETVEAAQSRRLGMSITARGAAQDSLREYVAARQAETLEELQNVYEALCRKQGQA